ncbi:MAG: hypothetical protein GX352_04240 [Clostridiales bacterium]|nr:hypothetical protein [Clostridiales bacterium]
MIYEETLDPHKNGSLSVIWTSLGLVALLIFIVGLSNLAYNRYGIEYSGYIAFLSYIIIGIYVYRKRILKYRYLVIDGILAIQTLVGRRNREIIKVALNEAIYFCPLAHEKRDQHTRYKNHLAVFNRRSSKAWVFAFKNEEKYHRIVLEPSEELIKIIKDHKLR